MDENPKNDRINQNFLEIDKFLRQHYAKNPTKVNGKVKSS